MAKISMTWKGKAFSETVFGMQYNEVRVKRRYKSPEQPLEDGTPVIDHKVKLPTEVTVSCCVRRDGDIGLVMAGLKDMCDAPLGASNVATVTDRTGETYNNLVLVDYGHCDNTSDKFDNYYFDLIFKEVLFMGGETSTSTANAENTDTQDVEVEVDI